MRDIERFEREKKQLIEYALVRVSKSMDRIMEIYEFVYLLFKESSSFSNYQEEPFLALVQKNNRTPYISYIKNDEVWSVCEYRKHLIISECNFFMDDESLLRDL